MRNTHRFMLLAAMMIIMVLAGSIMASAQEREEPAPGTPENNWCWDPERWGDGRCVDAELNSYELLWYWNCGWYHAHLEHGYIETIPAWCKFEAPPSEDSHLTPPPSDVGNDDDTPPVGDDDDDLPPVGDDDDETPLLCGGGPTCTATDTFGNTATFCVPNQGFQTEYRYYPDVTNTFALCFNWGWWCAGSIWHMGTDSDVPSLDIVSTTCSLPSAPG